MRRLLEEAGYQHAFGDGGAIDIHGIALVEGADEWGPSYEELLEELRRFRRSPTVAALLERAEGVWAAVLQPI